MHKKTHCLGLMTALFLSAVVGCNKSDSNPKASETTPPPPDARLTVARLHWLGKKRLAAENNATNLMAIWNLPESARLEAQTLDKLSTAPWRLLSNATPLSNAPTAWLRPLLDDLVQEESYLEVHSATNQPEELVLALRLDPARAALWRTNLPIILQSMFGSSPEPRTENPKPDADFRLQTSNFGLHLTRSGDWTILSFTDLKLQTSNFRLLELFRSRIAATQTPYPPRTTNYWFETEADLRAFANWIPFRSAFRPSPSPLENLPRLLLTLTGDGQNVRTRGELNFSGPVPIELEPWNIPTNLVHDPLIGFMGVRGIRPWLKSLQAWDEARLGTPPNQAFFWAQDGSVPLHFFAVPSVQASNQLHHLSEFLLHEVNPRFASSSPTHGFPLGAFERIPDSERIGWRGLPMISPNIDLADVGENPFITGGLFQNFFTNRPAPAELLRQFQTDTNLAFYDWEISQPGEYRLIQTSQAGRLAFGRARLSLTNNAALPWLMAISPKLGNAVTSVRLAHANRLTFSRASTVGFTAAELHLLSEWLESPSFPKGFFTLETKPVPIFAAPAPQPPTKP